MTLACGRGSTLAKDWTTRTCAASQILRGSRFSCVCLQVSSVFVCVRRLGLSERAELSSIGFYRASYHEDLAVLGVYWILYFCRTCLLSPSEGESQVAESWA